MHTCLLLCNNRCCCKLRPYVASRWFIAAAVVQDFAQTKTETSKFRFQSASHFGNAFLTTAAALPCTMQREVAALDASRPCHSGKGLGADPPLLHWVQSVAKQAGHVTMLQARRCTCSAIGALSASTQKRILYMGHTQTEHTAAHSS